MVKRWSGVERALAEDMCAPDLDLRYLFANASEDRRNLSRVTAKSECGGGGELGHPGVRYAV